MMAVDVFMARENIFSREGPEWGGVKRRRRSFETLSLEDAAILYAPVDGHDDWEIDAEV